MYADHSALFSRSFDAGSKVLSQKKSWSGLEPHLEFGGEKMKSYVMKNAELIDLAFIEQHAGHECSQNVVLWSYRLPRQHVCNFVLAQF